MEIAINNTKIKKINQCNYVIEAIREYHNKGFISKRLTVLLIKQIMDKAHIFDQRYSKNHKFFWYKLYKTNSLIKPLLAQFPNLTYLFILVKILKDVPMYDIIQQFKEHNDVMNNAIYDITTIVKTIKKASKMKNRNIKFEKLLNEVQQSKHDNPCYSKKIINYDLPQNNIIFQNGNLISNQFLDYKKRSNQIKGITCNSSEYNTVFNQIDVIVSTCYVFYKEAFKGNNQIQFNKNICLLLEQCSFDVEAFFNYLKYKEKVNEEEAKAKFLFTSADDYIILKMKDSDLYNEMINLKGEDAIQRRLLFLTKEI